MEEQASPTVFSQLENSAVERDNVFGQTPQAAKTARGRVQRQLRKTEATGADMKREGNAQGHGTGNARLQAIRRRRR